MIECTSTVLLLRSKTRCQWRCIWGMVLRCELRLSFPFSDRHLLKYGIEDADIKKAGIFYLIFSQKMRIMATAAPKGKSFQVFWIIYSLSNLHQQVLQCCPGVCPGMFFHRIHQRQHASTDDAGMSKHRLSPYNAREPVTRSTRHTVKSCDELTVVSDGVVTSWPHFLT